MKNLINKQREIIAVLAYIAIVAGLFYLLIFPLIEKIAEKSNKIQEEVIKQEAINKKLEELPKIEQQYKELNENAESIDILLDKNKAVVLIEKLEKLAESTENEIAITVQEKTEQPKAPAKGKAAVDTSLIGGLPSQNYLQMKISLTGKYGSIMNFIRLLENFEYYADITAIQISGESDSQNNSTRQSISDSGPLSNPFNSSVTKNKPAIIENQDNKLKASLDMVFYVR